MFEVDLCNQLMILQLITFTTKHNIIYKLSNCVGNIISNTWLAWWQSRGEVCAGQRGQGIAARYFYNRGRVTSQLINHDMLK